MDYESVQDFFNRADAFARRNGMSIAELREGYARASMTVQAEHLNAAMTVHGGALFTLADFAFAAASNAQGHLCLSINSSISIFRGARQGVLSAEARRVSESKKLASYEVSIRDERGELLAVFQGMAYRKAESLDALPTWS